MDDKLRILLIEDDEDDFIIARDLLQSAGLNFELDWAAGFEEGVRRLQSGVYDVCLLDYRLGPYTGLDLLGEVRKTNSPMPVMIFLTGQADHQVDLGAMEAGASDFLLKGEITPALLERSIRYSRNQARLRQKLERSNAELRRFAYVASHDLKEPLRSISGFAQLLAKRYRGKLGAEADEFIDFMVQATRRMNDMINDLLTYSRLDADTRLGAVDCQKLVDVVLAGLDGALRESGARVECRGLPVIFADRTKLHQVFHNLLSNAIKFRRQDVPPQIEVAAVEQDNLWLFSVQDNGCGITPGEEGEIMQVFTRLRDDVPGTGIGLAITKKAVEQHGGRLWVESVPGEGSTFYFTIKKDLGNGRTR